MSTLETHFRMCLKNALHVPKDTPDPFPYLVTGSLSLEALLHLRQYSLICQINRLGKDHISFRNAMFIIQSHPPSWSWWTMMSKISTMYDLPPPNPVLN